MIGKAFRSARPPDPEGQHASMLNALGVLALGRPQVFPVDKPGKLQLWASLLGQADYLPEEVARAIAHLLLRTRSGEWIDLGDLTARIDESRAEADKLARSGALRFARERRQERIAARVSELVADGWDEYQARVQAVGEIPDPEAVAADRRRGIVAGRQVAVGMVRAGDVGGGLFQLMAGNDDAG